MPRTGLDGRVALVTGAAAGIGRACAGALADAGAIVVVADRDLPAAQAAAGELGRRSRAMEVDVADPASIDRAVAAIDGELGRLDIAVNNAGVGPPLVPLADCTDGDWRRVMSVNLDGVFYSLRAELRVMRAAGAGAIVNMASVLGRVGAAEQAPYVAAKHGVVGLTRVAALEGAADGVRVNAVAPGRIRTPLLESALDEAGLRQRAAITPMRRLGEPREVGELVAWLCSDAASFVTGAVYAVDGGFLAQ